MLEKSQKFNAKAIVNLEKMIFENKIVWMGIMIVYNASSCAIKHDTFLKKYEKVDHVSPIL